MLGNWSLVIILKKKFPDLSFCQRVGLAKDRIYISVFEGNKNVPKDEESYKAWRDLGIPEGKIYLYGVDKNWWSRSGTPKQMPVGEIGGPDSEIFYDFGEGLKLHENSIYKDNKCHPNCQCGRFLEIGNSVLFNTKLERVNFRNFRKRMLISGRTGRITAAVNNTPDVLDRFV
jgi:alanyl-tRNA synthetase